MYIIIINSNYTIFESEIKYITFKTKYHENRPI